MNKATEQSSVFGDGRYKASSVVDNCTDFSTYCCTHTNDGQNTAWWRVDLGELMTITRIKIYYRDNFQHRLAGYQLYVSNSTSTPTGGVLCYEDTSSTRNAVQLVVTHQCPYVGRYVTVYNHRNNPKRYSWYSDDAILMLCEVQVFGCQAGKYGDGHCNYLCPPACYGGNCNSTTAACFYCFAGKYDIYCNSDCPSNCKNSLCTKDAGSCLECIPGKYGNSCDQVCPVNCKDMLCEKSTGNCIECIPGKYGNSCDQVCPVNCKDMLCEKSTGNCIDCFPGKYGPICEKNCPENCKDMLCERDTGSCKECKPGFFGANCSKQCHCKDAGCNYMTGNCSPSGCLPGWRGNTCSESCGTGSYGETCSLACPVTCKEFVCHHETGHCLDCYPGKYGVVCGADCPETCTDNICSKADGQCLTTADSKMTIIAVLAVICGLLVAVVIASAMVIYHLRKGRNRITSTDKEPEQSVPDN
ncbi:scavenger receptor class F member 1-like [Pecten maximus]|uniref:scavenger receptor class F member 1-like n=1 Tax=Pecten maximus TaxID=6579 RepID=UPI001458F8D2|nr:scavenger receptor class F member 1-like [Pecten maximus]